uniref:Uncharacterized protein n=1 Tax=Setaria viridis TaxID=4556 RepID=A0A4U6UT30_SETVI|nr:hypothetical protein SEVIR_4G035001v2 [Setaria viridis]
MTPLVARLFHFQGFTHFNWNVARFLHLYFIIYNYTFI